MKDTRPTTLVAL